MVSTQIGGLHCSLRGFHYYVDGKNGNNGISCMVSHLKMIHLCSDEWKSPMRNTIENYWDLFMALEESLRVVEQCYMEGV